MKKEHQIILAGAIGDAFGYNIEFKNLSQIAQIYGKDLLTIDNAKNWVVSDDTQMTLFCLYAIQKATHNHILDVQTILSMIYEEYQNWFLTQKKLPFAQYNHPLLQLEQLHQCKAPGVTCLAALENKKMGTIAKPINDSKGCGTIMRTAPISFLPLSIKEVIHLGCMQGATTHGHPTGYLSAGFFNGLIWGALHNLSFEDSYIQTKEIIQNYPKSQELIQYLDKIERFTNQKFSPIELNFHIGKGWIAEEALGVAIYTFFQSSTFEECLYLSANHEGDSDSTASIAAQLWAAFHSIPNLETIFQKIDIMQEIFQIIKN
jgi:ADP-ribosylglycohydrolase